MLLWTGKAYTGTPFKIGDNWLDSQCLNKSTKPLSSVDLTLFYLCHFIFVNYASKSVFIETSYLLYLFFQT